MAQLGPSVDPLFLSFQLALAGRYSIDRELGRGGMGIVYLAREVHLDRPVAIKLLPPERASDSSLRERFLREVRLAAKLSHPNIIPIHAVDDLGGFVFYVMAFIDGETLAQRVRTRGPLPSSEGARVLREVAWALAHAHAQGLVHRDVKPDNILLETATGRVLVADFGIAAATGDGRGQGVSGTPEFMSPEQALGKDVDARSDLYGLGVTAFYALSGRLPFEGKNATEVLAKQVTEPAPPLASLGLTVPRKVALLVDRCLAKEPEHRPASAEALAEQLGVAMEQRRELPAALRAFVKRNGRLDGSGTLFASLALLGGSIGASWLFGNITGFATFFLGLTASPLAYFVRAARRLSLLGFAHPDLGPAFNTEIEQAREEHAVEHGRGPSTIEKWLLLSAKVAGVTLGISLAMALAMPWWGRWRFVNVSRVFQAVGYLMPIAGSAAVITLFAYVTLLQRRKDVDTEFWAKLWMGRIGKLAFSVAKRMLGNRVLGSAMTHRATELSLGMAAENLYESLPKETRHELRELPDLIRRLQNDAQNLRKRHDELQEALADAGDAGSSDAYTDLRAGRDAIHAKLGEAVGALETIRLNLLRLHAGSGTVEGLTTHIDLAAEVSAEVERMLAAQEEVERGLSFPRETAATPV
jgi:serine/threonine-protein kinase